MSGEEKFYGVGLWELCRVKRVINDGIKSLLNLGKVAFKKVGWQLE